MLSQWWNSNKRNTPKNYERLSFYHFADWKCWSKLTFRKPPAPKRLILSSAPPSSWRGLVTPSRFFPSNLFCDWSSSHRSAVFVEACCFSDSSFSHRPAVFVETYFFHSWGVFHPSFPSFSWIPSSSHNMLLSVAILLFHTSQIIASCSGDG